MSTCAFLWVYFYKNSNYAVDWLSLFSWYNIVYWSNIIVNTILITLNSQNQLLITRKMNHGNHQLLTKCCDYYSYCNLWTWCCKDMKLAEKLQYFLVLLQNALRSYENFAFACRSIEIKCFLPPHIISITSFVSKRKASWGNANILRLAPSLPLQRNENKDSGILLHCLKQILY